MLSLHYFFNILEIVLLIVASFFVLLLSVIIGQIPLFHRNLTIFMFGMIISQFFILISQLIIAFVGLFDEEILIYDQIFIKNGPLIIAEYFRVGSSHVFIGMFLTIIWERAVATILLKSYEKTKNDLVLIGIIGMVSGYGIIATYCILNSEFVANCSIHFLTDSFCLFFVTNALFSFVVTGAFFWQTYAFFHCCAVTSLTSYCTIKFFRSHTARIFSIICFWLLPHFWNNFLSNLFFQHQKI